MENRLGAWGICWALTGLWCGGSLAADPPPRDELTFATRPGARVIYKVSVEVGEGKGSEAYEGELNCELRSGAAPGFWEVTGNLAVSRHRPMPLGVPRLGPSTHLDPVQGATSRFQMDKYGKITDSSSEVQLKLLLGDFSKWPFWPLPQGGQSAWQVSEPLMVQQTERDKRFSGVLPGPSMFDKNRLSAAIETASYKVVGREGPIEVIEQSYELKAANSNPPLTLTGKGSGRFDRQRGVFERLQWTRQVVILQDGAEVRVPVSVTLQRDFDYGLLPLTEEQKAMLQQQAEEARKVAESPEAIAAAAAMRQRTEQAVADARRAHEERMAEREREAAAPFDADERKVWIATLDAGETYGDGALVLSQLRSRTPRPDPELAQAIWRFANRIDGNAMAGMFWDLAASYDAQLATVLPLRKAYGDSYTQLTEMGDPIPRSVKLTKGQLVAVKSKASGRYYAKRVHSHDEPGIVLVTSLSSTAIEEVPLKNVRAPAAALLPYLPEPQRVRISGIASQPSAAAHAAPGPSEPRKWTDRSGRFSTNGRFVSLENDVVRLEKPDGTQIEVPLARLSEADAKVARELDALQNNPFHAVSP